MSFRFNKEALMNKAQLVEYIAKTADISKAKAEAALGAVTEGVTQALSNGDDVSLIGFGTFRVNERAARTGRNPRTGEDIQIAAAKVPAFKAGKALKEACNV
ncbi:HU family DNA-binding protein [Vibrio sagamiensis]|nr:HU family DNA-binding protein [Vibrio sagamiensis]